MIPIKFAGLQNTLPSYKISHVCV